MAERVRRKGSRKKEKAAFEAHLLELSRYKESSGEKAGMVYSSNLRFPSTNLEMSSSSASESSVGRISILSARPR